MAVRQVDIAKFCNISPAAVSKVLRYPEHPEFPEETRSRILSAAKELSYVPNQLAAGLRRGKLATISLLSAWNVPELQDNVTLAARQGDHNVLLQFIQDGDVDALFRAVDNVLGSQPAGLIWLPAWGPNPQKTYPQADAVLEKIHHMGCPVVWLEDAPPYQENCDFVWCDDAGGIAQAVEHLCRQGYEHFVFMVSPRPRLPRPLRWAVFQREVTARGFDARYAEHSAPISADDPAVYRLLAELPPNTAVLCEGDWSAVPVLHAAKKLSRRFPDDLGVMLFGDLHLGGGFSLGEVSEPQISAIRRPFDDIGRVAVRMLMERINGSYDGALRHKELPTTLIVRESTRRN